MASGASSGVLEPCVDQALIAQLPDVSHEHEGEHEHVHVEPARDVCALLFFETPPEQEIPESLEKEDQSVKLLLRALEVGVLREERREFWNGLYRRMEGAEGVAANRGLYTDTLKTCFGDAVPTSCSPVLPSAFQTSHTASHCLTASGKASVNRILACIAYNNPDVQHCPMMYSLTAALRHYMTEDDAYGFATCLLRSRSPKFASQTKLHHHVDWMTVRELNRKYNKKIVGEMESQTSSEEVEKLFQDWLWWIFDALPFTHLSRVVDCYLFEGQKVLLRVALSLVRHYSKHLRGNRGHSSSSRIKKGCLKESFNEFLKNITASPAALLDRAFKFKGLSKVGIQKLSLKIEIELKAKETKDKTGPNGRSQSFDDFPAPIHNLNSKLLSKEQLTTIWNWLPKRMLSIEPTLVYSSDEHGISLTTFYKRSEQYEPTILVIKAKTGELIGAYLSTTWAERNCNDDKGLRQAYFGTGETFLFQLGDSSGEACRKFSWVGTNTSEEADQSNMTKAEAHARELYMSGQHDMIAIGGGEGNGIFIDSTLTHGKSEHCLTFNNPPLCKNGDFEIACIEVYGLNKLDW